MKKLIFYCFICIGFYNQQIYAAGSAGLNFQTYSAGGAQPSYTQDITGNIINRTLLSTGTVSTVNYNWGSNYVLNSNRAEGVIVRFYGYINIPTAGTYYFGGNADDGIRINVNNTSVVNSWIESGGSFRSGSINLAAGVVPIELLYYENGGGAMVNLQWYINGVWYIIPSSSLATDSTYFTPIIATAVYSNYAISSTQEIKKSAGLSSNSGGHNSIVNINGDDNLISIQQIGASGHYVNASITGDTNTVNILQTSTTSRHYMEATIMGSSNNVTLQQRDSDKTQFVSVNGNNNIILTNQKGTGNHFLDLSVSGNNHTATLIQDGTGNHSARVILDGSQPWNFQLNQNGATPKNYNLPHSMTDGSTVSGTCSTVGGCNLTINQQ